MDIEACIKEVRLRKEAAKLEGDVVSEDEMKCLEAVLLAKRNRRLARQPKP